LKKKQKVGLFACHRSNLGTTALRCKRELTTKSLLSHFSHKQS